MKRILITFVALMTIALGAQAQIETTITWDEDFIKTIAMYKDYYNLGDYFVKKNAEKDGIQLDLYGTSLTKVQNGNIDLDCGSVLYFKYTQGTFKKIIIYCNTADSNFPNSEMVGWKKSGNTFIYNASGNPTQVKIDGGMNEYYGAHIAGIYKIEFTVLTNKFAITDIPEGWTVNNETPSNGRVVLPLGSEINVTPGNLPVGKRVKSIKLIPVE